MKVIRCCMITMLLFLTAITKAEDIAHKTAVKKTLITRKKIKQPITFMDCVPSTVMSGIAGVVTGSLTRYLEKEFQIDQSKEFILWLMFSWWLEHKARHSIVNGLAEDCAESEIPHKIKWMHFSAWLCSWTAYLRN